MVEKEKEEEIDENPEVNSRTNSITRKKEPKQKSSSGTMHKDQLSQCFWESRVPPDASQVGNSLSRKIHNVNRVHGKSGRNDKETSSDAPFQGQKFIGDLLEDGKIKSQETETIFCSPSAWAINCKKIINPEKKSGCGWASVKYKGKKLDIYKAIYHKKCQQQKCQEDVPSEGEIKISRFN